MAEFVSEQRLDIAAGAVPGARWINENASPAVLPSNCHRVLATPSRSPVDIVESDRDDSIRPLQRIEHSEELRAARGHGTVR